MDNSFQTSFIPKKPISDSSLERKSFNPFVFISVLILVLTILITLGLFFYKVYLTNHKEELSISLNKAKDSFEKETIEELELFSKRTEISQQILDSHIVLSPMLSTLGEITIPTVQYTKFDHQTVLEGKVVVKIQGVSLDYKSIALQSEMFNSSKGRDFKNVVFSNLVRNSISTTGNNYVSFDVEFEVDPSLLSFGQMDFSQTIENNEVNSNANTNETNNSNLPQGVVPVNLNINP